MNGWFPVCMKLRSCNKGFEGFTHKTVVFPCAELAVYPNYFKNEDEITKNGEKLNKDHRHRTWPLKIVKIVHDNRNHCKLEQSALTLARNILCPYCSLKSLNGNP